MSAITSGPSQRTTRKPTPTDRPKDEWSEFRNQIDTYFSLRNEHLPVFTTDANGEWEDNMFSIFLHALPKAAQDHYTCNCCRDWFRRYAGLVTIDGQGKTTSAVWEVDNSTPRFFREAVAALKASAEASRVTGVFLTDQTCLGNPQTGEWTHFHIPVHQEMFWRSKISTPEQRMAELTQDYELLQRSLNDRDMRKAARQALRLLETTEAYRSEKVIGSLKWFVQLMDAIKQIAADGGSKSQGNNLVWLAVATAPAGFCHVKNGVAGTLVEDLANGVTPEMALRNFEIKMDPLKYRRPTAAPASGQIDQAERLFAKLGLESALKRRYATLDDIAHRLIWRPSSKQRQARPGGLFNHLRQEPAPREQNVGKPIRITATRFIKTVLAEAEKIEAHVNGRDNPLYALVTATDPNAQPIFQWDVNPSDPNPVNWFTYSGTNYPSRWGLLMGWHEVTGVCRKPNTWTSDNPNQGDGLMFILQGCRPATNGGLALFPETIKSELHGVSQVIEAHSRNGQISGIGSACGLMLQTGRNDPLPLQVRVHAAGFITEYLIDRWE